MFDLNKNRISSLLNKNILVETFDEIDSTSSYIKRNIFSYDKEVLVCAKTQTSGRGRRGNKFISNVEGCYFSFSFFEKSEHITLKVALAIIKAIKKLYDINLSIKWVNDIFFNGLKCGGILSELVFNQDKPIYIIGIGLNINQDILDPSLNNIATSLKLDNFDINILIAEIYNEFIKVNRYSNDEVLKEYENNMFLINKNIYFTYENEELNGVVKGINDEGNLIVEVKDKTLILNSGEISLNSKKIINNL